MRTETDRMITEAKADLKRAPGLLNDGHTICWEGVHYPATTWEYNNGTLTIEAKIVAVTAIPKYLNLFLMRSRSQIIEAPFPITLTRSYILQQGDTFDLDINLQGIEDIEAQMRQAKWAWLQPTN